MIRSQIRRNSSNVHLWVQDVKQTVTVASAYALKGNVFLVVPVPVRTPCSQELEAKPLATCSAVASNLFFLYKSIIDIW